MPVTLAEAERVEHVLRPPGTRHTESQADLEESEREEVTHQATTTATMVETLRYGWAVH